MAFMTSPFKAWLLAAALFACAAAPASAASFSAKRGINLDIWTTWPPEEKWADGSLLLPFPEWRKFLKAADLEALKADGFDFVRMPVDPLPFLSERSAGLTEELLASVRDSVRLVNTAGLKVVVDMHLVPAGGNRSLGTNEVLSDDTLFDRYVELVRRMARTLAAEDPERVAFELMNEPTTECEGAEARAWADRLHRLFAAARSSATRLTLVLSGACWGSAGGLAALDPKSFPDDNLMWSFHAYDPFLLTHQGATWTGDFISYVSGIPYPPYAVPREELDTIVAAIKKRIDAEAPWSGRAGMKSYLDELLGEIDTKEKLSAVMDKPFATVAAWAEKNGIPPETILLGEFGMIRQEWQGSYVAPPGQRAAYYKDMIGNAEKHGYAWSIWSYGGAFGVVESFEGKKAEPNVLDMVQELP
ncbi:cellulase family glycosylhydrolase [Mesorhizobium sp. LHD-90]|uniref:glycoside hydrolase family 5 protein n=1 Tax=Mesorhizobium sp. LHD-90 TaxID=3071414 RepID=UPI0027E0BBC0|nr:cellulase family glycosylhydrolase [Mesorhizobium sp. LHD-90]MDQ6437008.1 cellulase family glycosylhydrolase [Mesorhizobium sp. LHD-90]